MSVISLELDILGILCLRGMGELVSIILFITQEKNNLAKYTNNVLQIIKGACMEQMMNCERVEIKLKRILKDKSGKLHPFG